MWRKRGNDVAMKALMGQRRWKTTHAGSTTSSNSESASSSTSSSGASPLTLPPIVSTKLLDAGYRFQIPWAVQWGDMDVFGHVNNCEYFKYFQHVRVDYLIALNISCDPPTAAARSPSGNTTSPTSSVCVNPHIKPIIAHIDCKFKIPVEFPDKLALGARVTSINQSASKFVLEHAVYSMSRNAIAATGQAVIVVYDYEAQKRAPFPDEWITSIKRVDSPALS
jgi:acyl-CoA thioester hydrolase